MFVIYIEIREDILKEICEDGYLIYFKDNVVKFYWGFKVYLVFFLIVVIFFFCFVLEYFLL